MAQRTHTAGDRLDELQSSADRLGEFLQKNLRPLAIGLVALLVVAGIVSYLISTRARSEDAASRALADARSEYLKGMGASPGAIEVPELANPEAAKRVRETARAAYTKIADEHSGTVSGALARLEVASLLLQDGDTEAALETFRVLRAEAPSRPNLEGMLLQREGQALEQAGRPQDAVQSYERAAALEGYPLRYYALADAARLRASLGEADAARALYERLTSEAPDLSLPEYQRIQRRELEAQKGDAAASATAAAAPAEPATPAEPAPAEPASDAMSD
jgi:predicted negative regulator of RcsB-dependent stress response